MQQTIAHPCTQESELEVCNAIRFELETVRLLAERIHKREKVKEKLARVCKRRDAALLDAAWRVVTGQPLHEEEAPRSRTATPVGGAPSVEGTGQRDVETRGRGSSGKRARGTKRTRASEEPEASEDAEAMSVDDEGEGRVDGKSKPRRRRR